LDISENPMSIALSFSLLVAFLPSSMQSADRPEQVSENNKSLRPKPVTSPDQNAIDASIRRGVEFLLKDHNKDGSWGTPHRTKNLNIYAPVPDAHHAFRAAVTALAVCALIEAGGPSDEVRHAIEQGEKWLLENLPDVHRSSADALYNVWSHIY